MHCSRGLDAGNAELRMRLILTIGFGALFAMTGTAPAPAQSVAEFYKANRVTIVIGYTPGGVYDLYARTVARHLGRHIPGHPTVVAQNMPGAGSMKAANYIFGQAPKDGSQIAVFARGLAMQPLLDKTGVQYDATKLNWLGSPASEVSVVFSWHTKPFKTVNDLRKREMIVPATGVGADSAVFPYILNGVLGTKFKVVTGYPGAAETMLSIERGETDGSAATSWGNFASARKEWIRDGKVNIILQLALKKHPALSQVPLVMDMATNDDDRRALELIFSRQSMSYPFAVPPEAPADRLAALQRAFDATLKDPGFLSDAKQQMLEVDPVGGDQIQALVRGVYASPPAVVARARAVIKEGMGRTVRK
jgi:tripartite-type tricarboxylate transporter receptor subunit TctC